MSDNNLPSDAAGTEPPYIETIRSLKADIDVIFTQLSRGDYASPDTFANNWEHLMRMIEEVEPLLRKPEVMGALASTDLMLAADLLAVSRSVAIIENFITCLARRAADGRGRPINL